MRKDMVKILFPEDCDCKTCSGGWRVPEGNFGGAICLCKCHENKKGYRPAKMIKNEQDHKV